MLTRNLRNATLRTFVVCGIDRGGTSMISCVLAALGAEMGKDLGATFEDAELADAVRSYVSGRRQEAEAALRDVIARRNSTCTTWGFKIPKIFAVPEIFSMLSFPVAVCVFRDSIAISERAASAMRHDSWAAFRRTIVSQERLADFFQSIDLPVIGFSYEKALISPERLVGDLCTALRLEPSPQQKAAAIASIVPSPQAYLDATSARLIGEIDPFSRGCISGWVLELGNEQSKLDVALEIDGAELLRGRADSYRADMYEYCSENLNHGFTFELPSFVYDGLTHLLWLRVLDRPQAKIKGNPLQLRAPDLFGEFECLRGKVLQGWIIRARDSVDVQSVVARIDGCLIGRASFDAGHADIAAIDPSHAVRWEIEVPQRFRDDQIHKVSFEFNGVEHAHLHNNPAFLAIPGLLAAD